MRLKANILLLLAAAIWGFAFVAQRVGMDYIGPFTYNGVRFALGAFSLLPLIYFFPANSSPANGGRKEAGPAAITLKVGLGAGLILFAGASLQQIGLIYTSAGKAAFITGLYIVLVPVMGIFLRQYINTCTWLGCVFAVAGLYFLCVKQGFVISYGDLFELAGAFFWTLHILYIDYFSRKVDTLQLALFQFITCSLLSLVVAWLWETISLTSLQQAGLAILYGGICSVGVAYTLQIIGQKYAEPSHAAIILSMETVFAAVGGYIILDERLGWAELLGCGLMMTGMLLAQLKSFNVAVVAKQIGDLIKGYWPETVVSRETFIPPGRKENH